jgi:hypothetical protein
MHQGLTGLSGGWRLSSYSCLTIRGAAALATGVEDTGGVKALVMELVEGDDLSQVIGLPIRRT